MASYFIKKKLIVVLATLRSDMQTKLHEGHPGVQKMKSKARQILYWRGMDADIEALTLKYSVCCSHLRVQQKELLLPYPVPGFALQKVDTTIFEYAYQNYLLVIDYFSKYPEVILLRDNSFGSVCSHIHIFKAWYS